MNREAAFDQVIAILKPYVKDAGALATCSEATSIIDDLKVNSARFVDIILALEDDLGVAIEDKEADKLKSIKDAVDLILARKST